MSNKEELRRRLRELFPRREELLEKSEALRSTLEQLSRDRQELQAELAARRENQGPPPWPGTLEPLVLTAAFLMRGGDVDSIAEKVMELSSKTYRLPAIRSALYLLVRRKLLLENDRSFTVTPQGERELAQARDDAKRWIDALGHWPGPPAANG